MNSKTPQVLYKINGPINGALVTYVTGHATPTDVWGQNSKTLVWVEIASAREVERKHSTTEAQLAPR